jgi:hypothetical protein
MRLAPRLVFGLLSALIASFAVTATAPAAPALDLGGTIAQVGSLAGIGTCGDQDTSAAFRPWGDIAQYVLAPSGDFSSAAGWDFAGARITSAASPKSSGRVLSIADGGAAVSPITCLSLGHPTIRLFARNTGGSTSRLRVTVLFGGRDGRRYELPVATLQSGGSWSPTPIMPVVVNLFAVVSPGGYMPVSFRFQEIGSGSAGRWQIDDLYVDPFKGH